MSGDGGHVRTARRASGPPPRRWHQAPCAVPCAAAHVAAARDPSTRCCARGGEQGSTQSRARERTLARTKASRPGSASRSEGHTTFRRNGRTEQRLHAARKHQETKHCAAWQCGMVASGWEARVSLQQRRRLGRRCQRRRCTRARAFWGATRGGVIPAPPRHPPRCRGAPRGPASGDAGRAGAPHCWARRPPALAPPRPRPSPGAPRPPPAPSRPPFPPRMNARSQFMAARGAGARREPHRAAPRQCPALVRPVTRSSGLESSVLRLRMRE